MVILKRFEPSIFYYKKILSYLCYLICILLMVVEDRLRSKNRGGAVTFGENNSLRKVYNIKKSAFSISCIKYLHLSAYLTNCEII